MFHFVNFVRPFVNYVIFRKLCDRMRFEVDSAKSHHRVISEGLNNTKTKACLLCLLFILIIALHLFCFVSAQHQNKVRGIGNFFVTF